MVRIFKIFAALLITSASSFSQVNIVSNPSFDNNTACPTITGQYHLCINWLNCNGNIGPGLWGTPDYYHACGIFNATYNPIPPNTALGFCNTRSGGGMMGLVCYNTPYPNYREYLSSNLLCPMQPGNTYTVSFWINAGTSPKVKYNTSHFGVYLSNTMPTQTGYSPIIVTPHYEITTVVNNTTWVQHTFTINPTSTFNWITLGCFRTDASITAVLATPSAGNPYSNYYVDDISVIGPGNIPATISSQSVTCGFTNNGSATITPTTAGSYTYNWQPGNQSTQSVSNLAAGIYTVSISNSCGSDTKTVSVGQQPTPSVSVNNSTACAGAFINITATTSGGTPGYTYVWSQGASTSSIVNVNASNSIITCTVTDSQGCKANTSASITVNNLAVSNFLFSLNACKGILTTTNTSTGASQYLWYFGDGNTSVQTSPSYTYSTAGNYTISLVANPGSACRDSISQTITINNPSQSIYSFTNVACDSTVLLNNTSIGATTYLWNFGDGNTSTLQNPLSHGYSTAGIYTITLITNPGSVCADTLKQVVSVNKNVISQFNASASLCTMSVSTINTSSFATTYAWNFGDGFTSTSNNPSHIYNSTGTYTISLIANPGTICADTTYQTVSVNGAPTALFSYIKDPCSANVTFTNNSINANGYLWNFGGAHSSNITIPVFDFNHPGTYTVSLIANPGLACADTIIQSITINYMGVVADFTYQNPQYTNDVYFTNLSQNAIKFDWIFGDGTSAENVFEPSHTYDLMGEFTVCLRATNTIGCEDIICKKIKVDADWTLYVPDAFTPNADGLNDLFFAKGTNISKFSMMIFDRWGEKIFSSDDIMSGWDGKYRGKLVAEDVYIWKINFTDIYSKSHDKVGHITVIR